MQPNVVFVADGAKLLQTVERASGSGAQRGDHVTWYQPSGDVFGHSFGQYGSGHPTTLVRLEHPHRHRSQETGFFHTRIGLIYIYKDTVGCIKKKQIIIVPNRSPIGRVSTPPKFKKIYFDSAAHII